jgi:hypothetical protein
MIRALILAAVLASTSSAVLAQAAPPASQEPKELMVAPNAPKATPEANVSGNPGQAVSAGGPADICQELIAYLQEKQQKDAGASGGGAAPAAQESGTAGPGQSAPPGDRPQQSSGQSAPIPQQDSGSEPAQMTLAQAQALAQAGDLAGCQTATRQMRRAGVALPPGLIALAALPEDKLRAATPR